jgi:hypothetical protein
MRVKHYSWRVIVAVSLVVLAAPRALAIWAPGDPSVMHFPQLPDISETGLDVLATPISLADDFRSSQTALATDITIWGAWLDDRIGPLDLNIALFSNIPAGTDHIPYSRPGNLLWYKSFPATKISAIGIAAFDTPLYDPTLRETIGLATTIVQYDIRIEPNDAFWVLKDGVYWLSIQRPNDDDGNVFGWLTSFNHFSAAGVFEYQPQGGGQPEIRRLLYPITHQYVGQYIDLSFVIATSALTPNDGDFDRDGTVDFVDYAVFARSWLKQEGQAGWNSECDISYPADGRTDMKDLVVFVQNWLTGTQ